MKYTASALFALAAVAMAQNTLNVTYTCAPGSASVCSSVTSSAAAPAATSIVAADCVTSFNVCRQPTNGVSANQAQCAAENAQCKANCQTSYDDCRASRNGMAANMAACAASFAGCLGENPFASNGTNTVTSAAADAGYAATTTMVVTALTTYCPASTQLTFNGKVYTVSSATTLTITDCPCTITTSVPKSMATTTSLYTGCNPAHTSCPSSSGNATKSATTTSLYTGCNPAHTSCPSSSGNATKSATPSVVVFQGAASREIVGASSVLAAVGSFFFLF